MNRHMPDGYAVPFTMHKSQRIDYPRAGYELVGNIGPRPGEEDLQEDGPMISWPEYLADYSLAAYMIQTWTTATHSQPVSDHARYQRAPLPGL